MFLDEKLLKIGRESELTHEGNIVAIGEMIRVCFENVVNNLDENSQMEVIISTFKRINNTWKKVSDILDNEGRGFVKRDGFKIFVESKQEFKTLFNNIKWTV